MASLTIDTGLITLVKIRETMARLPNLDYLSLSGALVPADRSGSRGIGTALGGRFGGKSALCTVSYTDKYTINMLLEVPTGLRFTEVEIHSAYERLPSAVRLVEPCGKTLVKLSYM